MWTHWPDRELLAYHWFKCLRETEYLTDILQNQLIRMNWGMWYYIDEDITNVQVSNNKFASDRRLLNRLSEHVLIGEGASPVQCLTYQAYDLVSNEKYWWLTPQ